MTHSGSMIDYGGNYSDHRSSWAFLLFKGQIACSFYMMRHDLEHNQLILCMLDKYALGSMQCHASESVHANIPGNSVPGPMCHHTADCVAYFGYGKIVYLPLL